VIISFEEPPNRKQFESEKEYKKAYKVWKKAFDDAMKKFGNDT